MNGLCTVLVDDEPLSRERLRQLLVDAPDFRVVGECADGDEAVEHLRELKPDVVFLDVEMPGRDGFDVLDELGADLLAQVVFVTAYERYAVKAFEVCALDYLLKPVDRERFHATLARVRERHSTGVAPPDADASMASPRLLARSGGRVTVLRPEEIDWVEARGNYLLLHVGSETHLMRSTLSALARSLEQVGFVRIHRSTLVRVACVRTLQPTPSGDARVALRDGTELVVSRTQREALERALR